MARPKGPTMAQIMAGVQIVQAIGNINWKGYKLILDKVKSVLPDYWGRALLVAFAAGLVFLVAYDWRRAHVEKLEAEAAVLAITVERDTLLREKNAELIARAQRAEDLANLSAEQVEALAEVKEILAENEDWASQALPEELRRKLDQ